MVDKKNILIIGAGPAGLSCAYELSTQKKKEFVVDIVEKDKQVGGLSKTLCFNGYYYDFGGHRFFTELKEVRNLWNKILKDDFITKKRLSRIYYKSKYYMYPLQLKNIFSNLGPIESLLIGFSFIKWKLLPYKEEKNFEQWVTNRFGSRLYKTFFKDYTEKILGISCNEVHADWAAQRIKKLSLPVALLDALSIKKNEKVRTLIDKFNYPKYGTGTMYKALASEIKKNKNFKIKTNSEVVHLNFQKNKWLVLIKEKNGKISLKNYDIVVSTMPLTSLILNMDYVIPKEIKEIAGKLKYRDLIFICLVFDTTNRLKDNWIYIHDVNIKMGRLQILNNWSSFMIKNKRYASYEAEYFCTENDTFWKKADPELIQFAINELIKLKIISKETNCIHGDVIRVKKAYPLYDRFYGRNIYQLIDFVKTIPHLYIAGRNGMFRYNNMDHSVYAGLLVAKNIISKYSEQIYGLPFEV